MHDPHLRYPIRMTAYGKALDLMENPQKAAFSAPLDSSCPKILTGRREEGKLKIKRKKGEEEIRAMLLKRKWSDSSITCPWDPMLSHSTFILRTAQGSLPQDLWSAFSKRNNICTHVHIYMNTHTHIHMYIYMHTYTHAQNGHHTPKLALYFQRIYGSPVSNTSQFLLSFWGKDMACWPLYSQH